jgi:hypothetical protein
VPLKVKSEESDKSDPKEPLLPFKLDGEQWACDFRNTTMVKLAILDLTSFRQDGSVRYEEGQTSPLQMLTGQKEIFLKRTAASGRVLTSATRRSPADIGAIANPGTTGLSDLELQLTFSSSGPFKHIYVGVFRKATKSTIEGVRSTTKNRVSWGIRRCGRIRMPYAAAMLNSYVTVISREAFDVDFTIDADAQPSSDKTEKRAVSACSVPSVPKTASLGEIPS